MNDKRLVMNRVSEKIEDANQVPAIFNLLDEAQSQLVGGLLPVASIVSISKSLQSMRRSRSYGGFENRRDYGFDINQIEEFGDFDNESDEELKQGADAHLNAGHDAAKCLRINVSFTKTLRPDQNQQQQRPQRQQLGMPDQRQ